MPHMQPNKPSPTRPCWPPHGSTAVRDIFLDEGFGSEQVPRELRPPPEQAAVTEALRNIELIFRRQQLLQPGAVNVSEVECLL